MRQPFDPDLEFQRGPTFWATVTVVVVGFVGNFVMMRPSWLHHGALLAGVVSSFRSGYYETSGNNAAIGVFLGVLLLTPLLVYTRIAFSFRIEGTGDTLFLSLALGLGWLLIVIILLVPVGYIGATVSDFTRKKVGGPIGY